MLAKVNHMQDMVALINNLFIYGELSKRTLPEMNSLSLVDTGQSLCMARMVLK